MSYVTLEGTKDFLFSFPALITTFKSSGSVTAGQPVVFQPDGTVALASGANATGHAGLCLSSLATAAFTPVLAWGYAKNLTSNSVITSGDIITLSGSGYMSNNSASISQRAGRAVTNGTLAGTFSAFINAFG